MSNLFSFLLCELQNRIGILKKSNDTEQESMFQWLSDHLDLTEKTIERHHHITLKER